MKDNKMNHSCIMYFILLMLIGYSPALVCAIQPIAQKTEPKIIPSLAQLTGNSIRLVALQHAHTFLKHPYCLTHYFKKPLASIPLDQQKSIVHTILKSRDGFDYSNLSIEQALLVRRLHKKNIDPERYDGKIRLLLDSLPQSIKKWALSRLSPQCEPSLKNPPIDSSLLVETREQVEKLATRDLSSLASMPEEGEKYVQAQQPYKRQAMMNYLISQAKLIPFLHTLCQMPVDKIYEPSYLETIRTENDEKQYQLSESHTLITKITSSSSFFHAIKEYSLVENKTGKSLLNFTKKLASCSLYENFTLSNDGHYLLHMGTDSWCTALWDVPNAIIDAHFKLTAKGIFLPGNKQIAFTRVKEPRTVALFDRASGLKLAKINEPDCYSMTAQEDKLILFTLHNPLATIYNIHRLSAVQKELQTLSVHETLCLARICTILSHNEQLDLNEEPPQALQTLEAMANHAPHIYALLCTEKTDLDKKCAVCAGTQQDNDLFGPNPQETHNAMRLQQEVKKQSFEQAPYHRPLFR